MVFLSTHCARGGSRPSVFEAGRNRVCSQSRCKQFGVGSKAWDLVQGISPCDEVDAIERFRSQTAWSYVVGDSILQTNYLGSA